MQNHTTITKNFEIIHGQCTFSGLWKYSLFVLACDFSETNLMHEVLVKISEYEVFALATRERVYLDPDEKVYLVKEAIPLDGVN